MSEEETKKRRPVKRWIILALLLIGVYASFLGPSILKPLSPIVVLKPEPSGLAIGGFQITNTILATLIADVILLLFGWNAYRYLRTGNLVPQGAYNLFEFLVEFLWNTVEGSVGKWAKRVFPVVATIFLIIFTANVIKLVPGFESIGRIQEVHEGTGYAPVKLFSLGSLGVYSVDKGQPVDAAAHGEAEAEHTEGIAETGEGEPTEGVEASAEPCHACEVVPFLRGSSTDLNFPLALAIIAVVMAQVYGIWSLGPGYFGKFFQFKELFTGGIFGMINFAVGLLEFLLEFFKVLSFAFRLFGNIFAGSLLLSLVGALTAVAVPPILYGFEVFFGIIQAYVFFLLATSFISMALVSHHGDDHAEETH